jgi:integrase
MASITKQKTGWRVQISVKGERDSATLSTKAEAQAWAVEREAQMRRMSKSGVNTDKTLEDAFNRYAEEVSIRKPGAAWEAKRLIAIAAHEVNGERLGSIKLCDVTAGTIAGWRDMRLQTVAGSTINRDLALISHVFTTARKEWKWIAVSPTTDVRRPPNPQSRDRRITENEIDQLCQVLGFEGGPVVTKNQAVAAALLFAIETAMRAGEICGLTANDVSGRSAMLQKTKNGTRRAVALSKRAVEILALLPTVLPGEPLFGLTSASLDALFRKARSKTLIEELTFHDTRHEAITRLAAKLNVLDLARMVGHRDLKMLQVYYNASAEDIAARLD